LRTLIIALNPKIDRPLRLTVKSQFLELCALSVYYFKKFVENDSS